MKRSLLRALVVMLASMVVVAFGATAAMAAEVTVAPGGSNAAKAIQDELDKSAALGKPGAPYVVNVKAGTYTLDRSLKLYSNVTLNLRGVTFKLAANTRSNMIRVGESDDTQTGYYYQNITVNGGTFDANKNSSTVLKAAHARNVTFDGTIFKNCYNSHLAEVAGIDGLTVRNCQFRDQVRNNAEASKVMSPEALQIDIINKLHFPTYRAEDLTMKNVRVENTQFVNVPRGVGSHTGVYNNPMNGIVVTGCTFTGIDTVAIEFQNVVNLQITNNVINSAPRGIAVNTIGTQGMFFSSSIAREGKTTARFSNAYVQPAANQNIVISGNRIICKGKDPHTGFENEAIVLKGTYSSDVPKGSRQMDALPKKDHYLSGVRVEGNTIETVGHGIRLRDAKSSTVKGNTINYKGSKNGSANYYGVQLIGHATNNVIEGNSISNSKTNGIFVSDKSSAKSIKGNAIKNVGKYGIAIQQSSATEIKSNKISKPKTHGIHVFRSSKVNRIEGNAITSAGYAGINVEQSSRVSLVKKNSIKAPKKMGIFLHHKSVVSKIDANKIASAKKYGIFSETNSTAKVISGNKITKATMRGIYLSSTKSKVSITKNAVSCTKGNAIYIDVKTKKYTVTVKANKLTGKASTANVKVKSGKVKVSGSKRVK